MPLSGLAVKLGSVFVRQISRPIANLIKVEATKHAGFKHFCVRVAQNLHFLDSGLQFKLLGRSSRPVRPLNEARAVENGANFLSETFIFAVASGAILFETSRQRQKEKNRREGVSDDIAMLQEEIEQIKKQLASYSIKIEDYKAPATYKPLVLQVSEDGKVQGHHNLEEWEEDAETETMRKHIDEDIKKLSEHVKERRLTREKSRGERLAGEEALKDKDEEDEEDSSKDPADLKKRAK